MLELSFETKWELSSGLGYSHSDVQPEIYSQDPLPYRVWPFVQTQGMTLIPASCSRKLHGKET